ncbi:MAG: hypothetical protein QGH40_13825, partial [bacterium]|nr:hypothetical protein [bacterium]
YPHFIRLLWLTFASLLLRKALALIHFFLYIFILLILASLTLTFYAFLLEGGRLTSPKNRHWCGRKDNNFEPTFHEACPILVDSQIQPVTVSFRPTLWSFYRCAVASQSACSKRFLSIHLVPA